MQNIAANVLTRRGITDMFNVQELINQAVEKNNQVKAGDRDGSKFHVSDAGGCYRARYYKRLGVEPTRTIDTPALRKMVAGDAGHEKLQYLLRRNGSLFAAEGTVETEDIKGHFDAIVTNGELSLLEIKTVEKWGMSHIKRSGAKREHKLQMFTYWYLLRKKLPNLDSAVLSYIKREDFEAHDFYFKWSEEIEEQVLNEWDTLGEYWTRKEIPPCTCKEMYDGAGPKYCRYSTSDTECCDELLYHKTVQNKEPIVMTN